MDPTQNQLQQILGVLKSIGLDEAAMGRLGDKLVNVSKAVGDFFVQRLETDANYAAGIGELARTAKFRAEHSQHLEKELHRFEDRVCDAEERILGAASLLGTMIALAQDPAFGLTDEQRTQAVAGLRGVLSALDYETTRAAPEVVNPPEGAETHRGTAECINGHEWPCAWYVARVAFGPVSTSRRIVFPERCDKCGERWNEIDTEEPLTGEPS